MKGILKEICKRTQNFTSIETWIALYIDIYIVTLQKESWVQFRFFRNHYLCNVNDYIRVSHKFLLFF